MADKTFEDGERKHGASTRGGTGMREFFASLGEAWREYARRNPVTASGKTTAPSWDDFLKAHPEFREAPKTEAGMTLDQAFKVMRDAGMTDEQALKVLLDAGAKLLRFRRKPDPEAAHVEAKNPEGFGDWHRISAGGAGATLDECVEWLTSGTARVERNGEIVTLRLGDGEGAGIGLLPASLGKLVVDIDLASKRELKTMPGRERALRSLAGHGAVRRGLGKPDGVQRSPSGGLHFYYPDAGIPEEVTRNATWAVDDAKVGGDIRGSNGWVGVYDLQALARMVQAGHGAALDVAKLRAFANNPHREAGMRSYRHVRAGGGTKVQAACAAIRSAEAGDTYAGRNPTIVYHVATLAKDKLLNEAAARAVLDAVQDVKPEAVEAPSGGAGEAPSDDVSGDLTTWAGWKEAAGKRRGEAEKLTREKQVLEGRKRDQDRRALHLALWERANTKERDSLVWKTILVWGVALVFVVVFNNARERADFRADCIEDTVRFDAWDYRVSGLSLREWCREQYAEALSADDDYYR